MPGGETCLYQHFGGAKALFCYVNLQVPDSVGELKSCKVIHLEGKTSPVPPAGVCLLPVVRTLCGCVCVCV